MAGFDNYRVRSCILFPLIQTMTSSLSDREPTQQSYERCKDDDEGTNMEEGGPLSSVAVQGKLNKVSVHSES